MRLNHKVLTSIFLISFFLTSCTTNITINEEPPADTNKDESVDKSAIQEKEDKEDIEKTETENSKADRPIDDSKQNESANTALNPQDVQKASDVFGKSIYKAFEDAGYVPDNPQVHSLENGNIETMFDASVAGNKVSVYATDMVNTELVKKTFDANVENAKQYNNMTVMEKGSTESKTIEVVRNNMANISFIIGMDTANPSTIYIINQTPEQLAPMLELLSKAGYPMAK